MEMISLIVVGGMAGGILVALLLTVAQRWHAGRMQPDAFAKGSEAGRTDVINIASIRVAGVGGLGLVVMSLVLAWSIPRIGQTLALGAVLGAAFAAVLILWRRRLGPIATSSGRSGANTTLSIDEPVSPERADTGESGNGTQRRAFAATRP
jgi:hypothetical protein